MAKGIQVVPRLLALSVGLLLAAAPFAGASKPDADFIAAALMKQEANAAPSLQVFYTAGYTWLCPDACANPQEVHYIRTPGILFKKVKSGKTAIANGKWNSRVRYDRATGELRRFNVLLNGRGSGTIYTLDTSFGFGDAPCPDPIALHLWPVGTLLKLIKQGVVADAQEEIDGHACWRVDIPEMGMDENNASKTRASWTIWVDPKIGFCPRRASRASKQLETPQLIEFFDYKRIGKGVYFPMRVTVRQDASSFGWECKVQKAVCRKPISAEDLAVTFPSGTSVGVPSENRYYTQP
ncbi:MAG: hypothetical protein Q7T82_15060 [Armatimonadota bacterium]|nr:hypothetical protein [Armatimonadota bacterium]